MHAALGPGATVQSLKRLTATHPAWWCVAMSAAAWIFMAVHAVQHWGHTHHHHMTLPVELFHWALMIAAMMIPLILDPLQTAAFRSLWSRRHRAMALFLVGYFAPWVAAGLPAALLHSLPKAHSRAAAAVVFGVAAFWALSLVRRRALIACHRTIPFAPTGLRADLDALRFGGIIGIACVVTCWPLMLACTLTGHDMPAMIGGAIIGAFERLSFRTPTRWVAGGSLALAAYYLLLSTVG
jgi:predicted metal-binding membrane protein